MILVEKQLTQPSYYAANICFLLLDVNDSGHNDSDEFYGESTNTR